MPKSCVAPECRRSEGARESYYKFPLHDRVRLKQWLVNMNVENFFPTKNQYLCSRHFKPSCFQVRWGVRHLRHDAVPTAFSSTGAEKTQMAKPRTPTTSRTINKEVCFPTLSRSGLDQSQPHSEPLTITLDPNFSTDQLPIGIGGAELLVEVTDAFTIPTTVMGAVNLVPLVHIVESFDGLSLALAPSQGFSTVVLPIELTGEHQVHELPLVEPVAILSEEHIASTSLQHEFYGSQVLQSGEMSSYAAINDGSSNDSSALMIENISIEPFFEAVLPTPEPPTISSEDLMSYLETMQTATAVPTLPTGPLPPLMSSSETVLSTAITRPIASTLPIVSKHSNGVGTSEAVCSDQVKEHEGLPESITNAELVSVVVNLQKKVRTLQQRHQKHCSKLEVMEGFVAQLKEENLISEEKMNLLELAYLNSAPVATADTDTIAIVCQEGDQNIMYSLPFPDDNRRIFHIIEQ